MLNKNIIAIALLLAAIPEVLSNAAGRDDGGMTGTADTRAQRYIESKAKEEPFRSGLMGVLAVTLDEDTLASLGSMHKLIPASNTKLISTGLAIRGLGSDYRFTTSIGYDGHVKDGVLHGDLYIFGGGDPTIASGDMMAATTDSLFGIWAGFLRKAGIRKIDGRIIGDGRFLDGTIENDSWSYNDLGTDYGTGCDGLCFNRNIQDYTAIPTSVGMPAKISVSYPATPWLEFRNNTVTAAPGSGDNLYLFNTDLAPVSEMRGSIAVDKGTRTEHCSNKFGALTCAWHFAKYLESQGIKAVGVGDVDVHGNVREALAWQGVSKYGLGRSGKAARQEDCAIIGRFKSPTIREIARVTNDRSDNFYAETLLRILSKERTGSASYDSCKVVILREMDSLGIDSSHGIQMVDGSGLARHNYISPDFFCRFLAAMACSPVSGQYLSVINSPGKSGMAHRLKSQPDAVKRRIFMKSGSMNGVVCYSGYILPSTGASRQHSGQGLPKGTIVFSIMTNNMPGADKEARQLMDELIPLIAECN